MIGRRRLAVAIAVLALVGVGAAAVTTFQATNGVSFQTDSGLTVSLGADFELESGNPFGSASSVTLKQTTFRAAGGELRLDARTPTFSNVTLLSDGVNYRIKRDDMSTAVIARDLDEVRVRSVNLTRSESRSDIIIRGGPASTVILNGSLPKDGTRIVAVSKDTGNIVGESVVDQQRAQFEFNSATFSSPTGVNFRTAERALSVRFEQSPSQLVSGESLTVRFFTDSGIVERTTSDGTVSLAGLPRSEPVGVTVNATQNTTFRRNVIISLFNQQSVFVVDKQTDTVGITFDVTDKTGRFGSEARLVVERPLEDFDGGGETEYQTVVSGQLGAGNFDALLVPNQRYRLRVINADGEIREIGSYVPRQSERVPITLGQIQLPIDNRSLANIQFETVEEDIDDDGTTEQLGRVEFVDLEERTERLVFSVETRDGTTIVSEQTVNGPLGTFRKTFVLNQSTSNTTFVLDYEFERQRPDGTDRTQEGREFAGDVPALLEGAPIDSRWLELLGFVAIVAAGGLVLVLDAALGALAATLMASLLTLLGVVAIPAPALGLSTAVSAVAILGRKR